MSGRLTEGFREIIELKWSEFVSRETNPEGTNFDSIVTSIARAASKGNLRAIQTSLDRLDGKIAAEIEVEYPKFYTLYPKAITTADDASIIDVDLLDKVEIPESVAIQSTPVGDANVFKEIAEEELPTGSLRAVLDKMLDSPRKVVVEILATAEAVDEGDMSHGDPYVKSVIVAGLMKLVHDGKIGAIFEVFDQIDGKVADKFKMLGDDVFMYSYATIAPAGAVKNENGIYQLAADNVTNAWTARLEQGKR
jgi:hypothetical protein